MKNSDDYPVTTNGLKFLMELIHEVDEFTLGNDDFYSYVIKPIVHDQCVLEGADINSRWKHYSDTIDYIVAHIRDMGIDY